MALHLVAYRLKNDLSYPARYQSLIDALDKLTSTKWSEETSLVLLMFNGTPQALHAHLMSNSKLYRNGDDMLVVMDIDVRGKETLGLKKGPLLDSLLLFAQTPKAASLSALGATLRGTKGRTLGS